MAMINKAYM